MPLTVLESFTQPKSPTGACEDRIVSTPHFVAVIDGAGDPLRRTLDGLSLGARAAEEIASVFKEAEADASLRDVVAACTRRVRALGERLGKASDASEGDVPPAASFVAVSEARREIWRVGDCGFLHGGVVNAGPVMLERFYTQVRRYLVCAAALAGMERPAEDPLIAQTLGLLRHRRQFFENGSTETGFEYGVIDGANVPPRFIERFELSHDAQEIVLASDGYPALHPTLAATEAALRACNQADPLCIGVNAGLKTVQPGGSFDDRSYVRLRAESIG